MFPSSSGPHFEPAISGLGSWQDWRVGRHGLVKIVANDLTEQKMPCNVDVIGLGAGVVDRLKELHYDVYGVNVEIGLLRDIPVFAPHELT